MAFNLGLKLPLSFAKKGKPAPAPKIEPKVEPQPQIRVATAKIAVPRDSVKTAAPAPRPKVNAGVHVAGKPAAKRAAGRLPGALDGFEDELDRAIPASAPAPAPAAPPSKAEQRRASKAALKEAMQAAKARRRAADEDVAGRFVRGDEQFLQGVRQARLTEGTPRAMWALYLVLLIVASAIAWATLAKVDVITHATGKIVPDAREQVIASLEGGILRALHVREGQLVEAGQDLVQLDPTKFAAQQNEGQAKRVSLMGTVARLTAEANGQALRFPPEVKLDRDVVNNETDAYQARRRSLEEAVAMTRRSMGLVERELGNAEQMANRGLMSDVEVMHLRRQRNDLQMQIAERGNRFRQDAYTELLKVRTELAQLDEQQVVRDDALKRTTLKSPVHGIVKNIRIGTLGGVVTAGAPILEIVPLSETLLVEAQLKPADIGFVRVGQAVQVKLSAYDFNIYGGLQGTLEYISPDALGDEKAALPGKDGTYYRARVRTTSSTLRAKGGEALQVLPGMVANVEIRTGDRTVLDFILKPMLRSREAFREH